MNLNSVFLAGMVWLTVVGRLTAAETPWIVKIRVKGVEHEFGGPLLKEEKLLVGYWRGSNTDVEGGDEWEIIRRADHTYTVAVTWKVEGERQSSFRHGLWRVVKGKYWFADVLERGSEREEGWPVDIKERIPVDELWVSKERITAVREDRLVTTSKNDESREIVHTEVRVKEFDRLLMRRFQQLDTAAAARLSDRIRRACITDFADIADYYKGPLTAEEKRFVGRWRGRNADPEDPFYWEMIRRADRSLTILGHGNDEKPEELSVTHGFWKVRHGKFIFADVMEGEMMLEWQGLYLGSETVVEVRPDQIITQWTDPLRRMLGGLFAVRIRNTERRVAEFQYAPMKPFSKADSFDGRAFRNQVRAAKRKKEGSDQ